MNKVLEYFKGLLKNKPFIKDIKVFGYTKNYDTTIISSVVPYLFDELNIIENLAPTNNENRDGRLREKKYIVIHDTGDSDDFKNALFWSNTVKTMNYLGNKYSASFQYVVGNDGIYHNIPDDEIAYHAGDSTYFDYKLYNTNIKVTDKCDIDIIEGYYYINGVNTNVLSPKTNTKILTKNDFNDFGILVKEINQIYYIGETYFNETYKKIANRGGNNNGIGMEVCINETSDIYLNYHLSAKLTAYLMDKYNLGFDSIKPHHYFSGKPCPQTLLTNKLWDHFMKMVEVEYQILLFKKEGYIINFIPKSKNILKNGRIISLDENLSFSIETIFNNEKESLDV